jgi:serine/threonine protein kinase
MIRLDQFARAAERSGLVPADVLSHERAALPAAGEGDPEAAVALAKRLIDRGALTGYQARKLLAGATRGFFLGGYRILKRLGEGGMGKVYLAVRDADGHKVAIKVLPPKLASESQQALKRFLREMDLSRRARHPNLARTLDVGVEGGVHFMVLEYIPGDSLYHLVKERGGPLRVPDAARYFVKVLDGLEAAHAAGLVHRDIKPSNLMVTPQGDAKVLDLGLARAMEDDEKPLTNPNTVLGTLDYASPEQLSDASKVDARSDLYSVGCTLYFTLCGHAPFEGGDVVNKIYKHRMEEAAPLEEQARGVPSAFAAIVRKLMSKAPGDRYQSAAELRADLARWTDPERVRDILGAEAEAARAFRPPPPELDDDDLRLLAVEEGSSTSAVSLRELGEAEPAAAPVPSKLPPPSRPAVVVNRPAELPPLPRRQAGGDDVSWLIKFTVFACLVGVFAVILLTLLL